MRLSNRGIISQGAQNSYMQLVIAVHIHIKGRPSRVERLIRRFLGSTLQSTA